VSYVVDRRLNGKNKSTVNRQRFLRRYRKHIKKAVDEAVTKRSITDLDSGESISIPRRDISEPHFHHGRGGKREMVHPGNKEFVAGDKVPRPQGGGGGSGSGSGDPSDSGEGIDDFVFQISQDEFLDFLFEDLELPNLVKRQLQGVESFKYTRAGVVNDGNPSKINIVRSMRQATSRRIALTASARRRLRKAEEDLKAMQAQDPILRDKRREEELETEIQKLRRRISKIPAIDTIDLLYHQHIKKPKPT